MELASLIEDLGKACGLELTLDEGRCTLRFDGEHDVTIERDGNAVILHGIAGDGGCLSNPDNLRILLTASFLGAETDGGALSVWERTGEIVLWKRFDAFTDYPDFEAAINAFLAQLIHWKARIDAVRGGVRFGHIRPRRDHGLRQYWGREGKRFWRLPTFFLPCKNFSVFQHRLTRSGQAARSIPPCPGPRERP